MITTVDITCTRKEYEEGTGKIIEELAYARVIVDDIDGGTHVIGDKTMVSRMTAGDFVAAAVNRSLYPAIELMRERNDTVILLLEGNAMATRAFIEPESIIETLAWLTIKAGVQTVVSDTIEHSANLISQMAKLIQSGIHHPIPLRHATPLASSSVLTRYVLEGLPGITSPIATALGRRFGSLHNLATASLDDIRSTPGVGYGPGQKVYHILRAGTPAEETEKDHA